jgi:predicted aminopeptidase
MHLRLRIKRHKPAVKLAVCALLVALLLAGCAASAYLSQSLRGETDLLLRAKPITTLLTDPETPPDLHARLVKVQAMRDFASRELLLPDNDSYRNYADLDRPFAVWNVFAAPALSVRLSEWCFPIAGCVGYRGYFKKDAAEEFADGLRKQGLDVYVAGIPAYSTLGYFNDPVLSTFIRYPETEIARLLFHELAHQVAYAPGDSLFNESFAVAVEREGMRRYLKGAAPELIASYQRSDRHHEQFLTLVDGARRQLQAAYASATGDAARREAKTQLIDALKRDYAELRQGEWKDFSGYDAWFAADLNNAKLGSIAIYSARVPAFAELLRQCHGELAPFYAEVKRLAALPRAERDAALDTLAAGAAKIPA